MVAPGTQSDRRISQLPRLARDMATMGGATALAALFNTLLVFLIPRLVSVEDFGYWRLFLLYAGYAGFLHLGFADGALLSWAGRSLNEFGRELALSLRFLFWQQLVLLVPILVVLLLVLHSSVRFAAVAVVLFALITNSVSLLQYALQAAKVFRPVAISTFAPAGIFLLFTALFYVHRTPNFRNLIELYCLAWTCMVVYLWTCAGSPLSGERRAMLSLGKAYVSVGWPILLANGGFLLVQSADRLVVSSILPIREFAQYSLASGTMFVPVMAIITVYRVFFSHVASVEQDMRATVYAGTSRVLLFLWSLFLGYYFALDLFVHHFLPKYDGSLQIASILLFGVLPLAEIQILHMSYFCLHGKQTHFLYLTIAATIMSFSVALFTAIRMHSLVAVAVGQVMSLLFWWLINEWTLRDVTGQGWKDWARMLLVASVSAASFGIVIIVTPQAGSRFVAYYAIVAAILWFACSHELTVAWRVLRALTHRSDPVFE